MYYFLFINYKKKQLVSFANRFLLFDENIYRLVHYSWNRTWPPKIIVPPALFWQFGPVLNKNILFPKACKSNNRPTRCCSPFRKSLPSIVEYLCVHQAQIM